MVTDEDWTLLGRTSYVSLGTWRRDGRLVETAVWIAPDGADLVVTTGAGTGKAKRLRNDARVRLRPCSRTGEVAPGAPTVDATAAVLAAGPGFAAGTAALARKYRLPFRLAMAVQRLSRRPAGGRVILRITRSASVS